MSAPSPPKTNSSFLATYDATKPELRLRLLFAWIRKKRDILFAELREHKPVFHAHPFTLVTHYRDVVDVLQRNDEFKVSIYKEKMDAAVGRHMLAQDNEVENYRDKSVMRSVMAWEDLPDVRAQVEEIVSGILPAGPATIDVVGDISRTVPLKICDRYFGFPGPSETKMREWSLATQLDFFKNVIGASAPHEAAKEAGSEMKEYIVGLLEERRKAIEAGMSQNTIVDRLVAVGLHGHLPFGETPLMINIAGLLIGAVETTSQAIAQALQVILTNPEVRANAIRLAPAGPSDAFRALVFEALRFDPINPLVFRKTAREVKIAAGTDHETILPAGSVVFACTASAMMDGTFIEQPKSFQAGRPASNYLHFGLGSHTCLGAYVAKTMVVETLRILMVRNAQTDAEGSKIDFKKGHFPERYTVSIGPAA